MKVPIVIAVALAAPGAIAAADPQIRFGKYEIEVSMESPNGATSNGKTSECLTAENYVPSASAEDPSTCKMTNRLVEGNRVRWIEECLEPEGAKTTAEGEVDYQPTTFEGILRMRWEKDHEQRTVVQKMKGRRVGDCTGGSEEPAKGERR